MKIYEAFSPSHARFIAVVTERLPELFPAVLETREAWVIAEWVEGVTLSDVDAAEQPSLLRGIHEFPVGLLPPAGFCYWSDFIVPRFLRAAVLLGEGDAARRLVEDVGSDVARASTRLSHPDLTPANLLRRPDGRVQCIDNELLCLGWLPGLDLCNAVRPLPQEQRDQIADVWFGIQSGDATNIGATAKAWIAREVGAAFVGGKLGRAEALLQAAERDALAALPFTAQPPDLIKLGPGPD